MDLHLTNKKALVTGSTAGIGFAIASATNGAALRVDGGVPSDVPEIPHSRACHAFSLPTKLARPDEIDR